MRQWHLAHPDYNRNWQKRHRLDSAWRIKRQAVLRQWRAKNRERVAAYKHAWDLSHQEHTHAYNQAHPKQHRHKPTQEMLAYWPFLPGTKEAEFHQDGAPLIFIVNQAVPALPEEFRRDVCQELLLMILAGEAELSNLGSALPVAYVRARRGQPDFKVLPFSNLSAATQERYGLR